MMNRRMLLGSAGAAAATTLFSPLMAPASAMQLKAIGLQLYTVRELFQKDPAATLEQVARIGYREVEFGGGGYLEMDPAMLRATTDRLGLRAPSVHVGYDALLRQFDRSVTIAKTLGADTIVLPFLSNEHRTEAGFATAMTNINRFAADLKTAGLGFAYHNHDFEFTNKPGGVSLFDRLVAGTDPALIKIELDIYWAAFAGESPAALIDRLRGRVYAYHVKDMRADRSMTAVGLGKIDFAALFKRKASAGVEHFYVENDQTPAPYLPDITTSFNTLRALRF